MVEKFAEFIEKEISEEEKTSKKNDEEPIAGEVIDIGPQYVAVDAKRKSAALIPIDEFKARDGSLEVSVGDVVELVLEGVEDQYGFGEVPLSREKAKRAEEWKQLQKAYENNEPVFVEVVERTKGGFIIQFDCLQGFLPRSLVDVKPIRNVAYLETQSFKCKIVKMDKQRNNIVVSRRAVIEEESFMGREELLEFLKEGNQVSGVVKNLTDYGAFIDLGNGIDGLLYITDMSWKRIKHPKEVVDVGDKIQVKVLRFDPDKNRVSLGLKQLEEDPWEEFVKQHSVGAILEGKVTNLTDYGCFVAISEGVEGLVHISEMDWTNKNIHPRKIVKVGDTVRVKVLDIDEKRRRISLGIKQCIENPWLKFEKNYSEGEVVEGLVKSVTDFGVFIELEGHIDGLLHSSDIEWESGDENLLKRYKKGDTVKVIVLSIDAERERVALGMKQLKGPSEAFSEQYSLGKDFTAKVVSHDKKNGNFVLALDKENSVIGYLDEKEMKEEIKRGSSVRVKVLEVNEHCILKLTRKSVGNKFDTNKSEPIKGTSIGDLLQEEILNKQKLSEKENKDKKQED